MSKVWCIFFICVCILVIKVHMQLDKYFFDYTSLPKLLERFEYSNDKVNQDKHANTEGNIFWTTLLDYWRLPRKDNKLSVVNGIIFLIEVIAASFVNTKNQFKLNNNSGLFKRALMQPQISRFLSSMKDENVIERALLEAETKLFVEEQCIQRLICSLKPIIKGMQVSLNFTSSEFTNKKTKRSKGDSGDVENSLYDQVQNNWQNASPQERLFLFFPEISTVKERMRICKKMYPNCQYS